MFGNKYNDNGERQADIDAENLRQQEWERNNYSPIEDSSTGKGLFSGLFSGLFGALGSLFKIIGYIVIFLFVFKILTAIFG